MNLKAFKWVTEQVQDVKGSELAVLLVLCYMANERLEAWPRQTTLARMVNLKPRQVHNLLGRLVERDYVRKRAPKARGYPDTLVLVTQRSVAAVPDIQPVDAYTSERQSSRTEHARNSIELLSERVKLTGVSPSKKRRVRCAHEGCIYLTDEGTVYCPKHVSQDTTSAKRA